MIRGFFSQSIGLVVTGVVSVILTPILVHDLGMFYYGLWILVTSLLDYYGLLDLGISFTLQRFVSRYHGAGDRKSLNETVSTATLGMAGIGIVLCGASFVLAAILPGFFNIVGPNRIVFQELVVLEGVSVAVVFPARVLGAYVCGLQRFDLYNVATVCVVILRLVFFIAVLDWGFGVIGIVDVTVALSIFSLAANYALARWADHELSLHWRQASWARLRELGHFSIYVFLSGIGDQLRFYTDSIVIAHFLTVALTTPFDVVTRLTRYYSMAVYPVSGPLTTALSSLEGQGREHELNRIFLKTSKLTCLMALLGGALLVLHGHAVLRLWVGKAFEPAYVLLAILVAGYVVILTQVPSNTLLYAKARHRALAIWTLGEGAGNLVLSIYWATHTGFVRFLVGANLPRAYYGLAGVALGTAVPMLIVRLSIQPWYVMRVAGIRLRHYVKNVVARPLLAFLPFIMISIAAQSPWMGATAVHLAITVVCESCLFAALAYIIALNHSDRQDVRQRAVGIARRLTKSPATRVAGSTSASGRPVSEKSEELLAAMREKTDDEAKRL